MGIVLKQLATPLNYLRISGYSKRYFDFGIPIFLTVIFITIYAIAPISISLTSSDGLIPAITNFVRFSSGFYITALAAVATFSREGLDEAMDNAPKLDGDPLSRRRFLCYLFGYLSFASIVVYVFGTFCLLVAPSVAVLVSTTQLAIIKIVCAFMVVLAAMNLFTTTLLGLYFLTDRMVRAKSEIRPVNDGSKRASSARKAS